MLAFIFITVHFILERIVFVHRLFPAPGEPVIIRKRYPFLVWLMQLLTKAEMRSISFSRNLNFEGTFALLKRSKA